MKKVAILIYPAFSIQEIALLMYLFRWAYDTQTIAIASSKTPVESEEGLQMIPQITFDEFHKEDYHCLILPGSSDFKEALNDNTLIDFLHTFRDEHEFVIGAICGGPLLLSMAGLLDDLPFTNSLYVEMNERFTCVHDEHLVYAPLVEAGNIITAVGNATREFAIAIANKVGFVCPDDVLKGLRDDWCEDDFKHHLSEAEKSEFETLFASYIR